MFLRRSAYVVAALGLGASCGDSVAPLEPTIDPVAAITSLTTVVVTGRAEPSAEVSVQGGEAVARGAAHASDGSFRIEVPLALGVNKLAVIASDATGNASEPTPANILREPARAESVRLTVERSIVDADDGTLAVQVEVGNDEPAVALDGLAVTVSVEDYAGGDLVPTAVILDSSGHGRVVVSGLSAIGAGDVVARADIAAEGAAPAEARAGFIVIAGEPTNVSLELSALVNGAAVGPANEITVPPGTAVSANVVVSDGTGNVVRGEPLTLNVQDTQLAIRARVVGSQILDANTAGRFTVVASLGEDLLAASADLVVVPGGPARIELTVSPSVAVAGDDVTASARIVDAFGNAVPGASIAVVSDLPAQDLLGAPQALTLTPRDGGTDASVNVRTAGNFLMTASSSDVTITSTSAPLVVLAGPVASGTASIEPTPLVAGEVAQVNASFADAFANDIPATFTVVTDAPGAIVLSDRLLGVTAANDGASPYKVLVSSVGGGAVVEVPLTVVAAAAESLRLVASTAQVTAGDAVTVSAFLEDTYGNVVRSGAPVLAESSPQDFAASPAPSTVNGVTTGLLVPTTVGVFTLSATDASGLEASEPLVVNHAAPTNVSFFDIDAAGLPYLAGDPVFFTYAFQDAFGNAFFDIPLVVTVNAPNVSVVLDGAGNGEIDGIVRSGSYTVRARAVGTGLTDNTEALTIGPNPADAGFNLQLSSGLISESGTALFTATDGFGNAIAASEVTLSITGPAQPVVTANRIVFSSPGTYAVRACLIAAPLACDTEFIGVQGIIDTLPPTIAVTITSPNPATSQTVPPRGLVSFRVDSADARGLSEVRFVASFSANAGSTAFCTTASGAVLLPSGSTSDSRTFSFNLPACAVPLDQVRIVAQAIDQAGNSANSADHTALTVSSPFTIVSAGFTATVAAFENLLAQPSDVVTNGITGELFVSSFGRDRIVVVAPDRTQSDARDFNGTRLNPLEPLGLVRDAAGNLFIHTNDAGGGVPGIERLRPDFTDDAPFIDSSTIVGSFVSTGVGAAVDETAGKVPLICSAVEAAGRVQCFTGFSAAGAVATMPINVTLGNRPVALVIDPPSANDTGDRLWLALNTTRQIRQFTFNATRTTLTLVSNLDLTATFAANQMGDMVMAPNTGNLIITNRSTGQVLRVTQAGVVTVLASGFSDPSGLTFDGASLLVVDSNLDSVVRLTPSLTTPGTF